MININELRIGNLIMVDKVLRSVYSLQTNHGPAKGTRIGYADNSELQFEKASSERIQPVLISDQYLERFGFTFDDYFKVWQRKRPERTYSIELDRDYTPLNFSRQPIVQKLPHIHLLQNLYFVIQGEELILPVSGN